MGQTTSDLISNIKMRGSFPTANDLFSNSDYLSILNDEMMNQVTPLITKLNEEFFLAYSDTSTISGTSTYRIPKRAVGSLLRDIQLIDAAGNVTSLPRLFEEDKYSTTQGQLGYYVKGNQIVLSPTPTSSNYTLRLAYFRRPSKFVLTTACAQITSIDTVLNQVVVSSLPSTMTSGTSVDFVQGSSPYDLLGMDSSISSVAGTTITFSSLPTDLAIGDYISLAGEACVPMVPEEMIPFLVQAALCVCLASKKDKSVELELQKMEQTKQTLINMLSPRVRSNDIKIKANNSLLNTFRGY